MAQSSHPRRSVSVFPARFSRFAPGLALGLALSSSVAAERFNLEHATKVVAVMNPQITPDGRRVVITVSRANLKENRFDTELVQVEVETQFIAYPVNGHAPQDPIHQRDVNRRWAEWIREHIEPPK